jgi:tripartite-type tricarboxylate transporter receptor subunit TctC
VIRCNRRQILRAGMAASLAGFHARTARSQTHYPQRPIRVIVPFAAGGVGDAAIRVLAPRLEQKFAQKLVIESKPGAAGSIGTLEVVRAEADGYTILVAAAGNFVINQFLMKMPFDPLAALTRSRSLRKSRLSSAQIHRCSRTTLRNSSPMPARIAAN